MTQHTLSGRSIQHALQVLATASGATVTLFDSAGEPRLGPIAGSEFVRAMLANTQGRELILTLHRNAFNGHSANNSATNALLNQTFVRHFTIPIHANGCNVGTLTLGDRPLRPLTSELIQSVAKTIDIDAKTLEPLARQLRPWNEEDATATRNMAALIGEMFADLCSQEEHLRQRIEELTAVYDISAMLAGATDLQQILDQATRIICKVMHVKACSIRLLDENTGSLKVKAVHNLSAEYLNKGPVIIDQNPIDQGALSGQVVHIADVPNDPRTQYPEQARKEGIVGGLVCGMVYRGKAVGVLRVYTGERRAFPLFEESLLRAVASQAAAAIVNATLFADKLEAERHTRQLKYAGEVQRRMIPTAPPQHPHADIAAVYRPTYQVGGDFYDFLKLPKGNLGIAIADVSGKGVPASLQMASVRSALRVYANFTYDVNKIMSEINRHVCRDTLDHEFATAVYGVLSPDARRFTYCNAGHFPPLLLRNGEIQELETGGTILGLSQDATFDMEPLQLLPKDVLLFYTDGVTEAMNFNDEEYGLQRLIKSLCCNADLSAERLVKNILWDLRRYRGLADRMDDVTIVAIKIQ